MSLLSISGVSKRFGGLLANDDISFEVGQGEIIGSSATTARGRPPCSPESPDITPLHRG